MAEADATEEETKKSSKMPLIMGLVLAVAAGGGGFFATSTGMIFGDSSADATQEHASSDDSHGEDDTAEADEELPTFLAVRPIVVNMPAGSAHKHLRFVVQLDVAPEHYGALESQQPRVVDIMNTYLRALEPKHFDERDILVTIRAHLMTRFNVVFGPGYVRDVLIMEFLLS